MTLIKLDSSATNGTPQNFTTTFSNFVLEENVDFEIAMISLSMNYSYPNVSSTNGNNTVEYSPNGGTNFYTVTIPDGTGTLLMTGALLDGADTSLLFGDSSSSTDARLKFGASSDIQIYHDGTTSFITNLTGTLKVATETSGVPITIGHTTSETTVADNLTVNGTTNLVGTLSLNGSAITVSATTINTAASTGLATAMAIAL